MKKEKKTKKTSPQKASEKKPKTRAAVGRGIKKPKEKPREEAQAVISKVPTPPEERAAEKEEGKREDALAEAETGKLERYWEAVGRRKEAVARVRLFTRGEKAIIVNGKPFGEYFYMKEQQKLAEDSLQKMKSVNRFRVSVHVSGGGLKAQAEAVRHGIARALVKFNPDFRKRLRRAGFLTRDPRAKERKKFGLKSARRAPQWAKR